MTASEFNAWLAAMKESRLVTTDTAAARLLGINPRTLFRFRESGADKRTALACRALYHRLEPWNDEGMEQ